MESAILWFPHALTNHSLLYKSLINLVYLLLTISLQQTAACNDDGMDVNSHDAEALEGVAFANSCNIYNEEAQGFLESSAPLDIGSSRLLKLDPDPCSLIVTP